MPRKPTGNPNGRPKKIIDQQEFEKLCAMQCTLNEVCAWFRVDDVTLNKWCKETYGTTFSEVFKVKRGIGQVSLRRSQFQMAEKNPTMAIWLGKQYLGQRENIEIDHGNNQLMEALTGLVRKQIDHD